MLPYILISTFCIIVGIKLAVNETPDKTHEEKNH